MEHTQQRKIKAPPNFRNLGQGSGLSGHFNYKTFADVSFFSSSVCRKGSCLSVVSIVAVIGCWNLSWSLRHLWVHRKIIKCASRYPTFYTTEHVSHRLLRRPNGFHRKDNGVTLGSSHTKDCENGVCCWGSQYRNYDWFARRQYNATVVKFCTVQLDPWKRS